MIELKDSLLSSQMALCEMLLKHPPDWRPQEGEWSLREITAHMLFVEIEFFSRIQRIATGENPHFVHYLNTGWNLSILNRDEIVSDWIEWRQRVFRLVDTLTPAQLMLTGKHDTFGMITVERVLDIALEHDQEHIADLQPYL